MTSTRPAPLSGLRILTLESRRGREMESLLEKRGAEVTSAPSLREVPLADQAQAFTFAETLFSGDCEHLVLLTGVGTQMLFDAMALRHDPAKIIDRLSKIRLYCRGPKPVRTLARWKLGPTIVAPSPNTWRELASELAALGPWRGQRVYVQEYGMRNERLMQSLRDLGAEPVPVPVYAWQLPEDVAPLERAVTALLDGSVDVIVLTSGHQLVHLLEVADSTSQRGALVERLVSSVVVASVGPVTTEVLADHGITADLEPDPPKMGQLVHELARRATQLAESKRQRARST